MNVWSRLGSKKASTYLPPVCVASSQLSCSVWPSRCHRPSARWRWWGPGGTSSADRAAAGSTAATTNACSECGGSRGESRWNACTQKQQGVNRVTQAKKTKRASIPGVPVVRSGVSAKLFAWIFVALKQRLLSASSVITALCMLLW